LQLSCRTLRVGSSRWLAAVGAIAGAVSAPLAALMLSLRTAPLGAVAVLGVTATVFAAVVANRRLRRNVTLDLDPRTIEDGYEAGSKVVLQARNGSVIEAEPVDRSPRDVLSELGLTLDQRALDASLRGVLGGFTRGLLAFMITWLAAAFVMAPLHFFAALTIVPPVLAIAMTALVVKRLRPHVVVGLDGIRRAGVLRPRFVPYSAIRSVRVLAFDPNQAPGEQIVIDAEGGPLVLPLVAQPRAKVDALVARIRDGRARYEQESARALESLERAGRPVAEWLAALRKLAAGGGFRDAALDRSDLERVVADPKVPLERRVGAALALRDDPQARVSVRVAADQAADPRVRVALEAACDEDLDEERLEATLE
jgi:hypothetical protein